MYTYTAVVHRKSDGFVTDSNITVTRQTENALPTIVARIRDSSDPCDHRTTTVEFENGSLRFSAAYDGPVRPHTVRSFSGSDVSLHTFYFNRQDPQFYLCSDDGFFPIHMEKNNGDFKITVYKSPPVPQADGLLYPVLASITKTQTHRDGFEYRIRAEEMPRLLLMAVFSLPFTLNL